MSTLDVGCGNMKEPGAVGIDLNARTATDIVHDLNQYPWPVPDGAYDRIICRHIVEHVADFVRFMEEIHRIGSAGATVEIVTPHFSSRYAHTDPTHVRFLSLFSFDYFVARPPWPPSLLSRAFETQSPVPDFYSTARFAYVRRMLRFARPFRLTGFQALANRFPYFYEAYLVGLFPARDLYITLRVLKPEGAHRDGSG